MNRKLGNFVKASLFALPFALPAVAFAQSAGGSSAGTIGATDNTSTRQNRTSTTTTTQTGTFDDSKPMNSDSHVGNLGIDREGNSTSDNNPVPSSDTTGDVDQHMTKRKNVQKHVRTSNDDGTSTTSDSTTSTTTSDKDINPR